MNCHSTYSGREHAVIMLSVTDTRNKKPFPKERRFLFRVWVAQRRRHSRSTNGMLLSVYKEVVRSAIAY